MNNYDNESKYHLKSNSHFFSFFWLISFLWNLIPSIKNNINLNIETDSWIEKLFLSNKNRNNEQLLEYDKILTKLLDVFVNWYELDNILRREFNIFLHTIDKSIGGVTTIYDQFQKSNSSLSVYTTLIEKELLLQGNGFLSHNSVYDKLSLQERKKFASFVARNIYK